MKNINLTETEKTPLIIFDYNKNLLEVTGKSFPEDPRSVYKILSDSIDEYNHDDLNINLFFEYLNTSSSKFFLEFLRKTRKVKNLFVKWISEEGDEEMVEMGEHFSELSGIPFEYELKPEQY